MIARTVCAMGAESAAQVLGASIRPFPVISSKSLRGSGLVASLANVSVFLRDGILFLLVELRQQFLQIIAKPLHLDAHLVRHLAFRRLVKAVFNSSARDDHRVARPGDLGIVLSFVHDLLPLVEHQYERLDSRRLLVRGIFGHLNTDIPPSARLLRESIGFGNDRA